MAGCLDDRAVLRLMRGAMPVAEVEAHLDDCAACRQLVGAVAHDHSDSPTSGASPGFAAAEVNAGAFPGRYQIVRPISTGAMSVVYEGKDPELDRRIAIKLLRVSAEPEQKEAHHRLLREARAMARVVHPNVIRVYDAGTSGDQVFIAMELLEGQTLAEWLSQRRNWRETLDMFVQAGRGLTAAHRAGLVHRDFKPDNVLVAADGRVLVTDFGLVRIATGSSEEASLPRPTVPGSIRLLGTPAYMSPEQFAGHTADARSDQFSFCVALHEALAGERPFAGATLEELRDQVLAGHAAELPRRRAPWRVRHAVKRGLSGEPRDRFPSMEELLSGLSSSLRSRVRWWMVGLSTCSIWN